MPKLTAKQAIDLLAAAGFPGVEVAEAGDSDYSQDTALQSIDAERSKIIKPRIVAELKDSVHGEMTAKVNKALRAKLVSLTGVEASAIEGEKDTDKMLEVSLGHYGTSLKKDIGKDKEQWIAERDQLLAAHNQNLAKKDTEYKSQIDQLNEQISSQYIHADLAKLHKEAKGLPATANREALAKDYHGFLKGIAIVKHNPASGEIELYDPQNPEQRLYNGTKTAFAKPGDFLETRYGKDGLGIWNTNTSTVNPADQMPKGPNVTQPASGTQSGLDEQVGAFAEWAGVPAKA